MNLLFKVRICDFSITDSRRMVISDYAMTIEFYHNPLVVYTQTYIILNTYPVSMKFQEVNSFNLIDSCNAYKLRFIFIRIIENNIRITYNKTY